MRELRPDKNHTEDILLFSKFPYRIHMVQHASTMIGNRFQVMNKQDFSDSTTIYTISKMPFYTTEVKVNLKKKYRYLVYQFAGKKWGQVAEIAFAGKDKTGKEILLQGKQFGNPGRYNNAIDNAFDNNKISYFASEENDKSYIGIDLGAGNAATLTSIKFCPRNDDNAINTDEPYELFVWEDGWKNLGSQKGKPEKNILFKNVPRNALLLLKNSSNGKGNRIFTYENGVQSFW